MRAKSNTVLIAAAAMVGVLSLPVPAMAGASYQQHYSFKGISATVLWQAAQPAGDPGQAIPDHAVAQEIFVQAFDDKAVGRSLVTGMKPVRGHPLSLVSFTLALPPRQPGGSAGVEAVTCPATGPSLEVNKDLNAASLDFGCDAIVLISYGDRTTAVMQPLTVQARWNAVAAPTKERRYTRKTEDGAWVLDLFRSTVRPAVAEVTVSGPAGELVHETISNGFPDEGTTVRISDTNEGYIYHQVTN